MIYRCRKRREREINTFVLEPSHTSSFDDGGIGAKEEDNGDDDESDKVCLLVF